MAPGTLPLPEDPSIFAKQRARVRPGPRRSELVQPFFRFGCLPNQLPGLIRGAPDPRSDVHQLGQRRSRLLFALKYKPGLLGSPKPARQARLRALAGLHRCIVLGSRPGFEPLQKDRSCSFQQHLVPGSISCSLQDQLFRGASFLGSPFGKAVCHAVP